MAYNFLAGIFYTKKRCSRLSSSEVRFYTKMAVLRFEPPLGDLGATYDDHLRLIGRDISRIPISVIELFPRCYG